MEHRNIDGIDWDKCKLGLTSKGNYIVYINDEGQRIQLLFNSKETVINLLNRYFSRFIESIKQQLVYKADELIYFKNQIGNDEAYYRLLDKQRRKLFSDIAVEFLHEIEVPNKEIQNAVSGNNPDTFFFGDANTIIKHMLQLYVFYSIVTGFDKDILNYELTKKCRENTITDTFCIPEVDLYKYEHTIIIEDTSENKDKNSSKLYGEIDIAPEIGAIECIALSEEDNQKMVELEDSMDAYPSMIRVFNRMIEISLRGYTNLAYKILQEIHIDSKLVHNEKDKYVIIDNTEAKGINIFNAKPVENIDNALEKSKLLNLEIIECNGTLSYPFYISFKDINNYSVITKYKVIIRD